MPVMGAFLVGTTLCLEKCHWKYQIFGCHGNFDNLRRDFQGQDDLPANICWLQPCIGASHWQEIRCYCRRWSLGWLTQASQTLTSHGAVDWSPINTAFSQLGATIGIWHLNSALKGKVPCIIHRNPTALSEQLFLLHASLSEQLAFLLSACIISDIAPLII